LTIYPGGVDDAAEGMVSLLLMNKSDKAIDIESGLNVIDGSGKQVTHLPIDGQDHFSPVGTGNSGWGWEDFAKRSTLIRYLVDGTLVIKVNMKLASLPFIPENPSSCKMI
jgi:hypothetical protein